MTARSTVDHYLPAGVPLPVPAKDGLDQAFWDGTRRHELWIQRCVECRTWQFGPEWICHQCHSLELDWEQTSDRGRLYSWERVWHPVHPALTDFGPYLVVLVELPEAGGVRLVGNLLGDPHQELRIGAELVAVYEDHDNVSLVQWSPADDPGA